MLVGAPKHCSSQAGMASMRSDADARDQIRLGCMHYHCMFEMFELTWKAKKNRQLSRL